MTGRLSGCVVLCVCVCIQHPASSVAISPLQVLLQELSQKEFKLWSSSLTGRDSGPLNPQENTRPGLQSIDEA